MAAPLTTDVRTERAVLRAEAAIVARGWRVPSAWRESVDRDSLSVKIEVSMEHVYLGVDGALSGDPLD